MIYDYKVLSYRVKMYNQNDFYCGDRYFPTEEEAARFIQDLLEKGFHCKLQILNFGAVQKIQLNI